MVGKVNEKLDNIDAKILHLIQSDAGLSVSDISEEVGLSSSPVSYTHLTLPTIYSV